MNKKLLSIVLMATIVMTPFMNSKTVDAKTNTEKEKILEKMESKSNGKLSVHLNKKDGLQVFISGKLSDSTKPSKESALKYLKDNKAVLDLSSNNDFKVLESSTDDLGFTHVKMQQLINGIPVYGRTVTVHYDDNGVVTDITGTVETRINHVLKEGKKNLSEKEALDIAKKSVTYEELTNEPKVERVIYYKGGKAYEALKVNLVYDYPQISNMDIFVDVSTGNIVESKNNAKNDGPTTGTGIAVNGTTRKLNLYLSKSKYYMKDTTKPMTGQILTNTANYRMTSRGTNIYSSTSTITDKAAVSAHSYAEVVYDFYKNNFNRNSIDGNGMTIESVVHYGSKYNNAAWNGYKMLYGDGDGTVFAPLSGDLDVVGHEMSHGVTDKTADLVYANQSGALNESVSDVLGVLIQTYDKYNVKNGGQWLFDVKDWQVGDEVYTPKVAGDALRSLADPTKFDQPAHMSQYVNLPNTQQGDWGGVHTNSGIPNKAAFLVAQSIGLEKVAKIYYRALTTYFNANTDFSMARQGLIKSATDLYGANSPEVTAIQNAFSAVGIE